MTNRYKWLSNGPLSQPGIRIFYLGQEERKA